MCTCNMSCKLTSCLKTLITLIAIEWLFANMSTLVQLQLFLILKCFLTELADIGLTRLVNQFVESE